jgi:hypothetical protein
VAAWVQVGGQALRVAARRNEFWRGRAAAALVFSLVFIWAAVAPQGALSLGERLRFSFEALAVVCLMLAASSGLRRRICIPREVDGQMDGFSRALANGFANLIASVEEVLPAVPFFVLLAALQAISMGEFLEVVFLLGVVELVVSAISWIGLGSVLAAVGLVCALSWKRNGFEAALVGLVATHVAVKVWIAWVALSATDRFRANLLHELATPIEPLDLAMIYRKRVGRVCAPGLIALTVGNLLLIGLIAFGASVPATLEQKFALSFALAAGIALLFLDASALFWAGILGGASRLNSSSSLSRICGTIIGIPWIAAWAFSALHSGEAVTLNESAAYFILWTLLGGSLSWIVAARSKNRWEREVRSLVSEP